MIKRCVVCGAEFYAPPTSKKITCSRDCSAVRKGQTHKGIHTSWSEESRKKRSETLKAQGLTDQAKKALEKAQALPESQRGEQNREAKVWLLIDPSGNIHRVVNLKNWAREHADDFDTVQSAKDRERVAHNVSTGFRQIALSMRGKRGPISTYKGWRLDGLPREKD